MKDETTSSTIQELENWTENLFKTIKAKPTLYAATMDNPLYPFSQTLNRTFFQLEIHD